MARTYRVGQPLRGLKKIVEIENEVGEGRLAILKVSNVGVLLDKHNNHGRNVDDIFRRADDDGRIPFGMPLVNDLVAEKDGPPHYILEVGYFNEKSKEWYGPFSWKDIVEMGRPWTMKVFVEYKPGERKANDLGFPPPFTRSEQ